MINFKISWKSLCLFLLSFYTRSSLKCCLLQSFYCPPWGLPHRPFLKCPLSPSTSLLCWGPHSCHSEHTSLNSLFQAAWKGGLHFWNNSIQLRKQGWRILNVWDSSSESKQRRGGKLQGIRSPEKEPCLLPLSCHCSNNPAKWCLLTQLQKVTGVHSSCLPHNQSFLSTERPGFMLVSAQCTQRHVDPLPTPSHPHRERETWSGWLCSLAVTKASWPGLPSRLSGHVQYQLWWHFAHLQYFYKQQ